jgi:hypothetical protein
MGNEQTGPNTFSFLKPLPCPGCDRCKPAKHDDGAATMLVPCEIQSVSTGGLGGPMFVPMPASKHDDAAFREKVKRLCDWCNDAIDWVELDATRHINTDKGRDLAREVLAMMDKP